ncbi:MAG: hypothetical protein ACM3JE_04705 [Betaproteobacteria bacterium]
MFRKDGYGDNFCEKYWKISFLFIVLDAAAGPTIAASIALVASTPQPVREDKLFDSATTITTTSP